jgi:hypothetical protein
VRQLRRRKQVDAAFQTRCISHLPATRSRNTTMLRPSLSASSK